MAGGPILKGVVLFLVGFVMCFASLYESTLVILSRPLGWRLPLVNTPLIVRDLRKEYGALVDGSSDHEKKDAISRIATNRLTQEPLDTAALWYWSTARDHDTQRRALSLGQSLSRRDRAIQLMLMRSDADDGNIRASLRHLDILMKLAPQSAPAMMRALVPALNDTAFRKSVRQYEHRLWYRELLKQFQSTKPSGEAYFALLKNSVLGAHELPAGFLDNALETLMLEGESSKAEALASRFVFSKLSERARFGLSSYTLDQRIRPLTWALGQDIDVQSTISQKHVSFDVEIGRAPVLMSRYTSYEPGSYQFQSMLGQSSSGMTLTWLMQCINAGTTKEFWRLAIALDGDGSKLREKISIPSDCKAQRWQLSAFNDSSSQGSVIVEDLELLPM